MVVPAKGMKGKDFRIRKAEKVYLLVHNKKSEDKASAYADEIVKKLKAAKIKTEKVPCDWYNIDEITKKTRVLILKEKGNEIAINLASGSKNHAIGLDRACMTFRDRGGIIPFYPEPKKWAVHKNTKKLEELTTGVKAIKEVRTHRIIVPEEILIHALKIIHEKAVVIPDGTGSGKKGITKTELAKIIFGSGGKQNLTKLQRTVTQKLRHPWKAIDVKRIGGHSSKEYISLTSEGDYLRYVLENPETSGQ